MKPSTLFLLSLVALALLGTAATARATVPGAETMTLNIGRPVEFSPGFLPAQVVCDDLAVIRVEDVGKSFRLTGLKAGTTLCSFTSMAARGRRRVMEITVTH